MRMVPEARVELARQRQRFLRPPRLPFRHSGASQKYTGCAGARRGKNATVMHRTSRIGEFAFELRENGEVIGAATNDAASKIAFERIEYAEAGAREYEIVEVKGDAEGVTYDETVFAVSVDVVDDGEGRLTAILGLRRERRAGVREHLHRARGA